MYTTTTARTRGRTRAVAACAAAGLAASGLALLAGPAAEATAPARAEADDLSLAWEISPRFDDHLSTHELGDGATEDSDGVITFPDGAGSYDPGTGVASVAYQGSVSGSFAFAGTTYYTVTLEDPTVTVDDEGHGVISAVVSASNAAAMGNPADSTEPARVVVTTFDAAASDWSVADGVGSLTATPHWDGTLPEGEESRALGIPEGQPVEGRSFAATFLGQLTSGVRAHFYASGASSDDAKAPSAFTMTASESSSPTVSLTSSTAEETLTVEVAGTGFTAVTNPGDAGIYVGLAESGGLPPTDDSSDQDGFVDAAWVTPAQMPDGDFTTTLSASGSDLDPRLQYSVYTWQAHTHSNTTQDTETPVDIDWSAVGYPLRSATAAKLTKPRTTRAGAVKVTVSGRRYVPGGKVALTWKAPGQQKRTWVKKLNAQGAKRFVLPRSAKKGRARLVVVYRGDEVHQGSRTTKTVRITR
ncbi:HtaA domain-containing protein [Nocardioides acrostichi]|uniref:HtaA domain-containing protein n=1 Tax=Nocardioides acrostichi TaxID=2784339 RepID=A0A930UUH5_9ACTN|nr:HtaA domain-containing protein [Nocardioides acrostichi]MBF4161083.1 HtaA domain-containing protein [Nocardioides acrostichi]